MKYNLIKTDNYLLVVDDSEIKIGDRVIENTINQIFEINDINKSIGLCRSKVDTYVIDSCRKIISHAPLNGAPYLVGVDVLPRLNQDDEVDKLAEERFPVKNEAALDIIECLQIKQEVYAEGYNKAREKYKWTNEDVIRIVEKSRETGLTAEYLLLTDQFKKK
jgi:hypothetical protein